MHESPRDEPVVGTVTAPFPSILQSIAIWGLIVLLVFLFFPLVFLGSALGVETVNLIYYVVVFGLAFYIVDRWRRHRLGTSTYGWRIPSWRVAVLVSWGGISLFGLVVSLTAFIPLPDTVENALRAIASFTGLPTFVALVIAAPVLEELIFRGIILDGLLHRYRAGTAILVSSLLFGLVHFNVPQLMTGFVLGCFIGWVYERTRSVGACILIHMAANLGDFIQRSYGDELELGQRVGVIESWGGPVRFFGWHLGLLIVFGVCCQLLRREFRLQAAASFESPMPRTLHE